MTLGNDPKEYIIYGDAEAAVVDILKNAPEIQAFSPIVTTSLNNYDAGNRYIEITRAGGSYRFPRYERPRIDIITYAERRSVAYDMIATAQAVMFREQGNYMGHGVNYLVCQVESGIFESNEKDTDQVRYILSLRLILKASPSTP